MTAVSPPTAMPSLSSAISRDVLKVAPQTSVAEVIQRMSTWGQKSSPGENRADYNGSPTEGNASKRVSCAIVIEANQVVGICTERDIVRLTATQRAPARSLSDTPVSNIMTSPVKTLEQSAFQDIFAVLFLFRRYRIRHLPIVDKASQLIGIVTPGSIRDVLRPANLLKMRRVSDIMSQDVVQAPTTASVLSLAQKMAINRVSCVVIVEASQREADDAEDSVHPPVGIVTERDIVQFQALGLNLQQLTAQQVMSSPLFLLDPTDSLWAANQAMQARRVRRLVVSWNWGKGLGIVTQTSLLRVFDPIEMCSIIDSLQETMAQLKTEREGAEKSQTKSVEALLEEAMGAIASLQTHSQINQQQQKKLQNIEELLQQITPR